MKTAPLAHHVVLGFAGLTQDKLLEQAETVISVAPSSTLINNPMIAGGVADVTAKAATLKTSAAATAKTKATLETNIDDEATAQTSLVGSLTALGLLVQSNAKSDADISGIAYKARGKVKLPRVTPDAPDAIDITTPPGAKGFATAAVHETGKTRGRYAAECATDPSGPWTELPGTGKARKVTYPSGTKVWIRFARVRGQLKSDWSAPVLVLIP